jgi:hypothetical protein
VVRFGGISFRPFFFLRRISWSILTGQSVYFSPPVRECSLRPFSAHLQQIFFVLGQRAATMLNRSLCLPHDMGGMWPRLLRQISTHTAVSFFFFFSCAQGWFPYLGAIVAPETTLVCLPAKQVTIPENAGIKMKMPRSKTKAMIEYKHILHSTYIVAGRVGNASPVHVTLRPRERRDRWRAPPSINFFCAH